MADIAKHIVFSGKVQGVGFRYTARQIASRYELTGFVRNLPDRTVEMFVQGNANDLAHCLRDINESFAPYIRDTKTEAASPNPRYVEFSIDF
ncbi:MAG: acylphosphatase [Planctomycetota bacterium]|jgi:acylphosphatase